MNLRSRIRSIYWFKFARRLRVGEDGKTCPFCHERAFATTAAFGGLFYCFGCDRGGKQVDLP